MHLSGRFVKSNHWRLWGLPLRGAVLDSHACAIRMPFACAIICGVTRASTYGSHVCRLHAPPARGRLVRRRFCLKKQGLKAAVRIWGLNAASFREARCAALTVNRVFDT